MKLVATDIPVIAEHRIKSQAKPKTQKVTIAVMVVAFGGYYVYAAIPTVSLVGVGIMALAGLGLYWYMTKIESKVKAYTHELMQEWKENPNG